MSADVSEEIVDVDVPLRVYCANGINYSCEIVAQSSELHLGEISRCTVYAEARASLKRSGHVRAD